MAAPSTAGFSASTVQRSRNQRQEPSSEEMAEILRAWDDEEDDVVEFMQKTKTLDNRNAANGSASGSTNLHPAPAKYSSSSVRVAKTVCLFTSFFGLGTAVAILGPTLLDLACHTHTEVQHMSYVFTSRSVGYLIGSMIGGWLFDRCNGHLVLSLSCIWATLMMWVLPYVQNVYGLVIVVSLLGIAGGSLDTGGNVLLLSTWGKRSRPYLQALHYVFAFGAFVAPLVVQPFLLAECPSPNANNVTNTTEQNSSTSSNITSNSSAIAISVKWAYFIGSIPLAITGVGFMVFAFAKSCSLSDFQEKKESTPNTPNTGLFYRLLILSLFSVFLLLYVGLEVAYGGYIFTFAVKSKPNFSKDNAAFLTSGFWGTFALSRLAAVPISRYLTPPQMLIIDMAGCLLGSVILVSQFTDSCFTSDRTKLWVGTVVLGVSMASVFPAAISWTEYFMNVTGKTASVLIVSACFGEMVIPLAVGNTITSVGPCSLMKCVMAVCILTLITYILINIASRYFQRRGAYIGMQFQKKRNQEEAGNSVTDFQDEVLQLLEQNNEFFNDERYTETS